MKNQQIKEFYFASQGKGNFSRTAFYPNGDFMCRMQCFEWSDGKLGCPHKQASAVQLSRRTGQYIWYSDYVAEGAAMGEPNKARHYGFHELQEAYHQFRCLGKLNDERCFTLLMEIIHAYNDEYHRDANVEKAVPVPDFKFFVQCVIEVQRVGKNIMPSSLKAELYREAGMFSKCFEFDASESRLRDEKEIIDEVRFRAAHGDSKPYIIEQCDYYRNTSRPIKRYPCLMSDC